MHDIVDFYSPLACLHLQESEISFIRVQALQHSLERRVLAVFLFFTFFKNATTSKAKF